MLLTYHKIDNNSKTCCQLCNQEPATVVLDRSYLKGNNNLCHNCWTYVTSNEMWLQSAITNKQHNRIIRQLRRNSK